MLFQYHRKYITKNISWFEFVVKMCVLMKAWMFTSNRVASVIMALSTSSKQGQVCYLFLTVWWRPEILIFTSHRRICLFSLCVSPERISPLILAELNATFCLWAIIERGRKKRPKAEEKGTFMNFIRGRQEPYKMYNHKRDLYTDHMGRIFFYYYFKF